MIPIIDLSNKTRQSHLPYACISMFDSFYLFWLINTTTRIDLCPSEYVTAVDLRNTFAEFLADNSEEVILKFPMDRIDYERSEGTRLLLRMLFIKKSGL